MEVIPFLTFRSEVSVESVDRPSPPVITYSPNIKEPNDASERRASTDWQYSGTLAFEESARSLRRDRPSLTLFQSSLMPKAIPSKASAPQKPFSMDPAHALKTIKTLRAVSPKALLQHPLTSHAKRVYALTQAVPEGLLFFLSLCLVSSTSFILFASTTSELPSLSSVLLVQSFSM